MPRTVTLTPDDLPDVTATIHDDGSYEFSITGLTGFVARPRDPTADEKEQGILASSPPTIRTRDIRKADLLMLRAVEMGLPDGTLDNVEGVDGALDKEQLLLAQLTRVIRRAWWELEPPA